MTARMRRTVVLGNFDGLHLGHQQLLRLGRQIADRRGEELAVFTFYPQIQSLRDPGFRYLLSEEEKRARFLSLGVDRVDTMPFSEDIARLSPEAFVREILCGRLRAGHAVVGFNYSFGYRGAGDAALLGQLGEQYGLEVTAMPPFRLDGEIVSSSLVREYLRSGNVARANALLGYPYSIEGPVVPGNQIGRTIGFPTANILPGEMLLLPANGVYAARTYVEGRVYPGILNVGIRPTIAGSVGISVETHLFDFSEDIYGKRIRTEVLHFLRREQKFSGLEALRAQLEQDRAHAAALFAADGSGA